MSPRCHLRALGRVPCGRSSGIESGALSLVSCLSCLEVEQLPMFTLAVVEA
jgi:hypothetical protein